MQDNNASLQDPPQPTLFASKSITRFKFLQTPKGNVQNVTHEKVCYTQMNYLNFPIYTNRNLGIICWNDY